LTQLLKEVAHAGRREKVAILANIFPGSASAVNEK